MERTGEGAASVLRAARRYRESVQEQWKLIVFGLAGERRARAAARGR